MASVVAHSPSTPLNLTFKLGSILSLPSRFLTRIRLIDELLNQDIGRNGVVWDAPSTHTSQSSLSSHATPFPGPWGFLTSGYALVLFAMAVLLHRIQNIVVPPQRPLAYDNIRHRRHPTSLIRSVYNSILPLNFSLTSSRLIFYLPSLYFLVKVLLLWVVILLQTSGLFPRWKWNWLVKLGSWAAEMSMDDVCWRTFCAICGASCMETLVRGLEGTGTNGNLSPFNLHGYAFLLHIYASPITHAVKKEGLPSRPDKHVIVTMTIPLLQLAMLHVLGIRKRWSHHRLVPTTFVTVLSLTHFYSVLLSSPSSYPLLNYMTCIFESFLVAVTLLTVSLNALTQILLEGTITRPLFGYASTLAPKWDEDFSMALIRIGVASLEATSVAGLGNEVGGVVAPDTSPKPHLKYGTVEISRTGVASISLTVDRRGRREKVRSGFANEIRNIKTGSGERELWDKSWYKGLARFTVAMWRCAKGLCLLSWNIIRGRPCLSSRPPLPDPSLDHEPDSNEWAEKADVYSRFLRGENVSDDEDDEEFEPCTPAGRTPSSGSDNVDDESGDDNASIPDEENETVALYADLSSASSTSVPASFLLAHMTSPSASPLTRRRYKQLLVAPWEARAGSNTPDDWSEVVRRSRQERGTLKSEQEGTEGDGNEMRRNCVICTVEARQIICWPCRCLALCDGCRENLAAQSAASKHRCPCCRRNVEGYSKIFIP